MTVPAKAQISNETIYKVLGGIAGGILGGQVGGGNGKVAAAAAGAALGVIAGGGMDWCLISANSGLFSRCERCRAMGFRIERSVSF
jgi:uncharacterized protein YcfJ